MVFETWLDGDLLDKVQAASLLVSERPQPLIVTDLSADVKYACLRLRPDARSAAALPLRTRHYLGVLILNSRLHSNFRQDQEPLLASYALQASVALKHALHDRRLEDTIIHLMRSQQLPIELLEEAMRIHTSETRFDRILETVRGLFRED
jgi:GAF domain-containing protein